MDFVKLPIPILKSKKISSTSKIIYSIILSYSACNNGSAYLCYKNLCLMLDTTKMTIYRSLMQLKQANFIKYEIKNHIQYIIPMVDNPKGLTYKLIENAKESKSNLENIMLKEFIDRIV